MSGFVAINPSSDDTPITNNGFFIEISPSEFREIMRLDSSITGARIRNALIDAMGKVNTDLNAWQNLQQDQGANLLTDVIAAKIDNKSTHEHDYQRAVFCLAKADLTEQYQDYDSSANGTDKAQEIQESIDDYRRQSRFAIRRILGIAQSTIELI
jgi:hypothetical protein